MEREVQLEHFEMWEGGTINPVSKKLLELDRRAAMNGETLQRGTHLREATKIPNVAIGHLRTFGLDQLCGVWSCGKAWANYKPV